MPQRSRRMRPCVGDQPHLSLLALSIAHASDAPVAPGLAAAGSRYLCLLLLLAARGGRLRVGRAAALTVLACCMA